MGGVQCLHHLDAEVVMLADELGGNLLGGAGEEGLGEVGGYGGGFGWGDKLHYFFTQSAASCTPFLPNQQHLYPQGTQQHANRYRHF